MKTPTQATWGGRFAAGPAADMVRFSESVSFDQRLAPFDIAGSRAHAAMLAQVGLLSAKEAAEIDAGLEAILGEIEAGDFVWRAELEDVHMNIEQALLARTPAGAKLHTARSRNDQVATDVRLWIRWACDELVAALEALLVALVEQAEKRQGLYVPAYTHLQRAQPVSVAHHLLAYVEMFARDRRRFAQVAENANVCPLGSGALAGTTLPIDREATARALGFVGFDGEPRITRNSLDAVADRDVHIEFAQACALCGVHLSRVAEDMILWNSAEFAFARLPEGYTTGSSLMPQKKNPDAMELIRGKSARLIGHAQALLTLCKGLPLTYNRDLQEDKPPLFDAFDTTGQCLGILCQVVRGLELREDKLAAAVSDPLLLATDLADHLVRQGVAFREAHHRVGELVARAEALEVPLSELPDAEAVGIEPRLGPEWRACFQVERSMAMRERPGMPGPGQVAAEIARWREILKLQRA